MAPATNELVAVHFGQITFGKFGVPENLVYLCTQNKKCQ